MAREGQPNEQKRKLPCLLLAAILFLLPLVVTASVKASGTISGSVYLDNIVTKVSDRYGVDPLLIHAMIRHESAYDIYAISHKGAQGLMQLMPVTQRDLGVRNPFDPWQNVDGGVRYMVRQLLDFGTLDRALAAYNAGPQREKGRKRPRETSLYITNVSREYLRLKKAHARNAIYSSQSDE